MNTATPNELFAEMRKSELGDERRSERLAQMVQSLQRAPGLGFPKVFSEAELEGAYRFFSNPEIEASGILSGHWQATSERVRQTSGKVIVAHDTTTLEYARQVAGLTPVRGRGRTDGFLAHVSLAVESGEARMPLGNLGLYSIVRKGKRRKAKSVYEKESERWWCHVLGAEKLIGERGKLLHVMDREADDYGLFSQMQEAGMSFVIRLYHDRRLLEPEQTEHKSPKLLDALQTVQRVLEREVKISSRKKKGGPVNQKNYPARQSRMARLSLGATRVTLQRPDPHSKARLGNGPTLQETLTLNVVHVWEELPQAVKSLSNGRF